MIKVFRSRDGTRFEARHVKALLYRICKNGCFDRLRQRRTRHESDTVKLTLNNAGTVSLDETLLAHDLGRCIGELQERQHTVVLLRGEGHSNDEIAEILEVSPATATRLWQGALRTLAACLKRGEQPGGDDV
jgi:RNA polymerase sigma factor (sigma-70 family)